MAFTVMRWEVQRRISDEGATESHLTRPLGLLGGEGKGAGVEEEKPVRRPLQSSRPEINQKMRLQNTKKEGSNYFLAVSKL